ncbi:MAG TPA: response regulator transcription factor, partial [Chitinophagales bacterium]|nr:response regulator transcription factor [Chitinophagales bacterium]
KCMIVDDEPLAQQVLQNYIARVPDLKLQHTCRTAMEAFELLHKEKIDLLFLDIHMPVMDGLSFLRSLKNPPSVIFTTAYPEHALEGFDLDAVDYLLKPIPFERFLKAVNKTMEQRRTPQAADGSAPANDFMFVKADNKLVKVTFADVLFVEAMKDYLRIYMRDGKKIIVHHTMKKMEEVLPSERFIRVHKSYIASLQAIKSISGNMVEVENQELPIGALYKEQLLQRVYKST